MSCVKIFFYLFFFVFLSSPTFSLEQEISFQSLPHFLQKNPHITKVEEFLQAISPQLTSNYSLFHSSKSLQESSFDNPRVIITLGKNGRLALSFNGDPEQVGFNQIEMMEFNQDTAVYEFRELDFSSGTPVLSQKNPTICLGCHGQDPRPLWDSYGDWKGAYGALRLYGPNNDPPHIKKRFSNFQAKAKTHPRYQHLPPVLEEVGEVNPVVANINLTAQFFSAGNFQRIIRLIQETPFYEAYKYAFAAAFLCTPNRNWPKGTKAPEFLDVYLPQKLAAFHKKKFKPFMAHDKNQGMSLALSYLLDARGISTLSWGTNINPIHRNFERLGRFMVGGIPHEFIFGGLLMQKDDSLINTYGRPKLNNRVTYSDPKKTVATYYLADYQALPYCQEIKKKSHQALDQLLAQHNPPTIFQLSQKKFGAQLKTPLEMLRTCLSCHTTGRAPFIPFNDRPALKKKLSQNPWLFDEIKRRIQTNAGPDLMPPRNPLLPAERAAFIQFLHQLKERN